MIIRNFQTFCGTLKAVPLHPPPLADPTHDGGDFTPWTEFYWGGGLMGGGGIFWPRLWIQKVPPQHRKP